jgi:GMP synthase (glutamine-hydrolysing)
MKNRIIVLDFGSQYTQLIARRLREMGVYSEVLPCDCMLDSYSNELSNIKGIILSGGPASVLGDDAPLFDAAWFKLGVPVLGICYGLQLMVAHFGGVIEQGMSREYGPASISILEGSGILEGFGSGEATMVWMSHGDHARVVPAGFKVLAESDGAPVAVIGDESRHFYGLQFHPEVNHSVRGTEILSNFVFRICHVDHNWTPDCIVESALESISRQIGSSDTQVICGLSGGVDSAVAAVLVNKVIGERLHCIFVDNGLLRQNEAENVVRLLGSEGLGLNIHLVRAADRFLNELEGVVDPERKRKIIGRVFIEVFEEEARRINNVSHLVQGTLYPDVIESVSHRGPSATIKTHHNVGGLPDKMDFSLIEPLRDLFKDEVRRIGRVLEMPENVLQRQPFPGPGLAVRILGAVTSDKLAMLRQADAIFLEEIKSEGLYDKLWQAFCVLLPVKSVGVMGDGRTYEEAVALRAVTSQDGMTADWYYLPEGLLRKVSSRIINEVRGINRVVLDISSKPPATIEWE